MQRIVIIGGGFTGLAAAYYLSKKGHHVIILEKDQDIGGLAGSFNLNGVKLEKFYHHWFTSDTYILDIVKELGKEDEILYKESNTGLYYNKNFYKLSTPKDLLQFNALKFINRIRLGALVLYARRIKNWKKLEEKSAYDWIKKIAGTQILDVLWKPLLEGKFGDAAPDISAVWFWNKIKLRGGSRGKKNAETLLYYKGGFARLAEHIADVIRKNEGVIHLNHTVKGIVLDGSPNKKIKSIITDQGEFHADQVLVTTPLPDYYNLIKDTADTGYLNNIQSIPFLANICVVLELKKSLSETYWLNISEPGFPFVGVIEHTNFESTSTYNGSHIVYLSKYLPENSDLYRLSDDQFVDYSLHYIMKMFPEFQNNWIIHSHVWRAKYSQPVIVKNYSKLIPGFKTPYSNMFLSTMAQIYPEDRGTNYAIREGRKAAELICEN